MSNRVMLHIYGSNFPLGHTVRVVDSETGLATADLGIDARFAPLAQHVCNQALYLADSRITHIGVSRVEGTNAN